MSFADLKNSSKFGFDRLTKEIDKLQATGGSSDVFVEGKAVHRVGDSTGGHGSFVANAAASGSGDVKAN